MRNILATLLVLLIGYGIVYGQVELKHEVADNRLAQIESKLLLYTGEVPDLPEGRVNRIEAIVDFLLVKPTVLDELKVNLNTGSLVELMSLDGIGKAKGEGIIESREAQGPFTDWRDAMTRGVGIGPETYKDLIAEGRAYIE